MTNRDAKKVLIVASAVAGLMAMASSATAADAAKADGDKVKCYGINKCKGTGACGGPNGCAGQNDCAGHGHIVLEKELCLKIQGGRLTPDAQGK